MNGNLHKPRKQSDKNEHKEMSVFHMCCELLLFICLGTMAALDQELQKTMVTFVWFLVVEAYCMVALASLGIIPLSPSFSNIIRVKSLKTSVTLDAYPSKKSKEACYAFHNHDHANHISRSTETRQLKLLNCCKNMQNSRPFILYESECR